MTREWWDDHRAGFELFVSELVVAEAEAGDSEAARLRLQVLEGMPLVALTPETRELAKSLLEPGPIARAAAVDAFHVAAAVSGGADYLLTWNFKHLANAALRRRIDEICLAEGYDPPVICTPEELLAP